MQQPRIDEVDGLRAAAMTAVVAQHCGIAPFGWTGVWLFFVISGYVIARNFQTRAYLAKDRRHEYRKFMVRRFFRIVPVYLLYLLLGAAIVWSLGRIDALRDVPFLLTFNYNWQMIFNLWPNAHPWTAFAHLWTLSIEQQFYVLYPFLYLLLAPRMYMLALIALVAAGPFVRVVYSAALTGISHDEGWMAFSVYAASFAHFDAFLLGALIARSEGWLRRNDRVPATLAGAALVAAAVYAFCFWNINRTAGATGVQAFRNIFSGILFGSGREVLVYAVVNALAAVALIWVILRKPITRPLAWPFVALVGRISYGAYLYHALVLWLLSALLCVDGSTPSAGLRIALFIGAWSMTVAVAYASYRWFEKPIDVWSRRMGVVHDKTRAPAVLAEAKISAG